MKKGREGERQEGKKEVNQLLQGRNLTVENCNESNGITEARPSLLQRQQFQLNVKMMTQGLNINSFPFLCNLKTFNRA